MPEEAVLFLAIIAALILGLDAVLVGRHLVKIADRKIAEYQKAYLQQWWAEHGEEYRRKGWGTQHNQNVENSNHISNLDTCRDDESSRYSQACPGNARSQGTTDITDEVHMTMTDLSNDNNLQVVAPYDKSLATHDHLIRQVPRREIDYAHVHAFPTITTRWSETDLYQQGALATREVELKKSVFPEAQARPYQIQTTGYIDPFDHRTKGNSGQPYHQPGFDEVKTNGRHDNRPKYCNYEDDIPIATEFGVGVLASSSRRTLPISDHSRENRTSREHEQHLGGIAYVDTSVHQVQSFDDIQLNHINYENNSHPIDQNRSFNPYAKINIVESKESPSDSLCSGHGALIGHMRIGPPGISQNIEYNGRYGYDDDDDDEIVSVV